MNFFGKWLAHFPFLKKGDAKVENKRKGMTLANKQLAAGWIFLTPATILIFIMSFYPIIQAFITSFKCFKCSGSFCNNKLIKFLQFLETFFNSSTGSCNETRLVNGV